MGIVSKTMGGAIGMAIQTGALASFGTTIGIAAGIGAAHKIVTKAERLVSGKTSFEKVPSPKDLACLGIVATDRVLHAGFRAFDQKVSSWLGVNGHAGKVSLADDSETAFSRAEELVMAIPRLTDIVAGFHGPNHEASVRQAIDVIENGSEELASDLMFRVFSLPSDEGMEAVYAALAKRSGR